MTHHLLEQLATQRQDVLAARVRARHPRPTPVPAPGAGREAGPATRRTTARRSGSWSRLAAFVSRA
ncbi:hypothetical protein [Nocardioides cynanchi]|uniref:hypothetical protein n=1 Tax=Nocardioides cynanchi TaxID=2558918 RepID=UPI001781DF09|nr:hypothetical protein [Nocardioides cynanchi]